MDACQRNYFVSEQSFLDGIRVFKEFLHDKLVELSANEPLAASKNTITTAGPHIPGFHSNQQPLVDGTSNVCQVLSEPTGTSNSAEVCRLDSVEVSFHEGPFSLDNVNYHQLETSFGVSRNDNYHPSASEMSDTSLNTSTEPNTVCCQPSRDPVPQSSDDQHPTFSATLATRSSEPGLQSYHRPLVTIPSFRQDQLPLVGTSTIYQVQPESTGRSSSAETCWYSVETTFHQGQPSLDNSSHHQIETSSGVSRDDDCHSSEEMGDTSLNTIDCQLSTGLLFPCSDDSYSTFSTSLAPQSSESGLQFCRPLLSEPLGEVNVNSRSDSSTKHCSTNNIDEKSFECNECHMKFRVESVWKSHSHKHTAVKKLFECDKCDKKFTCCGKFEIHYRIHTGEKPFKCTVCDETFTQSGNLKVHCRIHSGEKPFMCDICEKTFALSATLKKHYRIHSGEKPFKCDICEKTFVQSQHLKKHYRIHSGEKPFKCDRCDKTFTQSQNLKRHYRVHTGEKPQM